MKIAKNVVTSCWRWLSREEHRRRARQLRDEVNKAFTEHPREAGETYWTHLWFTSKVSARFLYTTIVIMIHGIFPFLLTRAASNATEETYRLMKTRIPKDRRDALDSDPGI
jgi:hypothetical protein